MEKIRVLIVDDAVVARRILSDGLSGDPDIEVAGTASNGRIALGKIAALKPDVVTMDVEMPELNGLETLIEIRKEHPRLPVIMFSPSTVDGASVTLDALALGASDYVTKPANVHNVAEAIQFVREELIPKIKMFCCKTSAVSARMQAQLSARQSGRLRPPFQRMEVLAIGVSTGGPNALGAILPLLPADFPVPILIVQHMPAIFTRLLAERLSSRAQIRIGEVSSGQVVQPGAAWIAAGNHHMLVERSGGEIRLVTNQEPPENGCRPAVDPLLRSVAEVYGDRALAVILTGMGRDGLLGCQRIRELRGTIIVQDESTSTVWGMPGAVAKAGLADAVVPLERLADEIIRRVQAGRAASIAITARQAEE